MDVARNDGDKPDNVDDIIKVVDQEIHRLCQQCLLTGYSELDIYVFSTPIIQDLVKSSEKNWTKSLKAYLYAFLTVGLILGFAKVDWTPVFVSSFGRNALIDILPYWDWTQMYYRNCFIQNPFFEHRKLIDEDCLACEPADVLSRLSDVTHKEMAEDYLKSDVPVIIQDGFRNWDLDDKRLSIQNVSQVLLNNDPTGDLYPCTFVSNLRLQGENYFRTLLLKLVTEDLSLKRWYAHWENCAKMASKALRRLYPRPYFLPPMVDATDPNWVFASANFRGRIYKEVTLLSDMMWLAQLQGFTRFQLRPRSPCNNTCLDISGLLIQGETLVFTDRMWIFQYLPGEDSFNVAIGGGGSFEV